jgi:hypothetical protein
VMTRKEAAASGSRLSTDCTHVIRPGPSRCYGTMGGCRPCARPTRICLEPTSERGSVRTGRRCSLSSAGSVAAIKNIRTCLRRSTDRRENAPLLSGGGSAASNPAGGGVDRRAVDHGPAAGDQLVVPAQDGGRRDQEPESSVDRERAGECGDQGAVVRGRGVRR